MINKELRTAIKANSAMFSDALAYRDELGRVDGLGTLIRLREAARKSVSDNEIEHLFDSLINNTYTNDDVESVMFQDTSISVVEMISERVKELARTNDINAKNTFIDVFRALKGATYTHLLFMLND